MKLVSNCRAIFISRQNRIQMKIRTFRMTKNSSKSPGFVENVTASRNENKRII